MRQSSLGLVRGFRVLGFPGDTRHRFVARVLVAVHLVVHHVELLQAGWRLYFATGDVQHQVRKQVRVSVRITAPPLSPACGLGITSINFLMSAAVRPLGGAGTALGLASGTMPIAAGVVDGALVIAGITLLQIAAEIGGTAGLDGVHHVELGKGQGMSLPVSLTVLLEDVGQAAHSACPRLKD